MGNSSSSNALTSKQIEQFKQSTQFTREELQEWYKIFMREHPSGKMNKQTFIRENQIIHGGDAELWDHLFTCMDSDNNGTIDFKEFIIAVSVGTKGSAEQKLKWAFSIYDIDKNGTIEYDEMLHLFKSISKMGASSDTSTQDYSERCKRIFELMDVNGDGRLTLDEFMNGCKQDQQILKALNLF